MKKYLWGVILFGQLSLAVSAADADPFADLDNPKPAPKDNDPFSDLDGKTPKATTPAASNSIAAKPVKETRSWTHRLFHENFTFKKELYSQFTYSANDNFEDRDGLEKIYSRQSIGFEVLKRFNLIIDYPRKYLLLRPNILFREAFEHDMCGFELLATGQNYRRYLVTKIEPGSPAAQAGLQEQEEILGVDQLPVGVLNLTQLSRIFHSGDGQVIMLIMRRVDGEIYTTLIKLKRQI